MITITHVGSILEVELQAKPGILVHSCNTQGTMDSGIALDVKTKYPKAFQAYKMKHVSDGLELGDVILHVEQPQFIIANAVMYETAGPRGRDYIDYKAVEECFAIIYEVARVYKLPVHFPKIEGGDWVSIEVIINRIVKDPVEKHLWFPPTP